MKTLRIYFYVLDLLVLAVMLFSINHAMTFHSWWTIVFFDVSIILRLVLPFLLYWKVRWRILPITAFTAIFGYFVLSNAFHNVIYRMALYPGVILHNEDLLQGESLWSGISNGELLVWCVILWTWLIPLVIYVVQLCLTYAISVNIKIVKRK